MTLTRDAAVFGWWIAVVASIATYFAAGGNPGDYTFQQWMQAIIAIAGIITAKLGTSPLQGRSDVDKAASLLKRVRRS